MKVLERYRADMSKMWLKKNWIIILIISLAIYFIIFGIVDGNYEMTKNKASMICTECIGLG